MTPADRPPAPAVDALSAILDRYLAGEASPAELTVVEQWRRDDPGAEAILAAARRAGRSAVESAQGWNVDAAVRTVMAGVERPAPQRGTSTQSPRVLGSIHSSVGGRYRWRTPRWFGLAAAAAIIAGVGVGAVLRGVRRADVRVSGLAERTYVTAPGERATVRLMDGTEVTLGPATTVWVLAERGTGVRELALEGEALFTVVHDTRHPFRVRTARAVAEDIGTRFAMRSYATDTVASVSVAEGRVAVRATGSREGVSDATSGAGEVGAGEGAIVSDLGAVRITAALDSVQAFAWAAGRLVFRDAPLRDVLPELARWYGLDVRLGDPALGAVRLSGTFRDESPHEALDAIALLLHAQYQRQGHTVVFTIPRGSS